ncbi:heterokaryon incompatibility protein-domain-containing protein [Xylaria sp. FL0043]|nr:heterokaryon incompatibility protein-domain-containing protein [Xylaria sp. FL0043]
MNTREAARVDDLAASQCNTYQYTKLPKGTHRYIRLLELQPGHFTENIHIKILEAHRLDAKGKWEALSYVWGSEEDPAVIHVGEMSPDHHVCRELRVTRNLEEALRYLRYKHGTRTMWIDAICINQADKAEQSAHVAEMGEIYRSASRVIAWLGAASDNSSRALDFLGYIASQVHFHSRENTLGPSPDARDRTICDIREPLPVDPADLPAIRQLWEREWFKRVWIRQEIMLATRAVIQIGTRTLPWEQFRAAVICIYAKCWQQDVNTPKSPAFHIVLMICVRDTYFLSTLRRDLNGAKCRDPRDYIYGILSLLRYESKPLDIQPDYSKATAEVYKNMAFSHLSHYGCLDIMYECELTGPNPAIIEGMTLPSWVPDWSSGATTAHNHEPEFFVDYFRSNITRLRSSKSGKSDILRVVGVECAAVDHVFKFDHEVYETLLSNIRSVWLQIEAGWPWKRSYRGRKPSFDAFCRSLGQGAFQEEFFPVYRFYPRFTGFCQALMAFVKFNVHETPEHGLDTLRFLPETCKGRAILILSNGCIGLGLSSSKRGDIVCFFLGSCFPVTLRYADAQSEKYYVVGRCYVPEMMLGEPLLGPLPENLRPVTVLGNEYDRLGFIDESTTESEIIYEDPRLEKLGVDLSNYKRAIRQDKSTSVTVTAGQEDFSRIGVALRYFDLV